MAKEKKTILFVCVGNACRSQMAEGFARHYGDEQFEVYSAGSRPAGFVAPQAIAAMEEKDIDISHHYSKGISNLPQRVFDLVITMGCDDNCPTVKAKKRLDWEISDPLGGSEAFFNQVRDEIETKVRDILEMEGSA